MGIFNTLWNAIGNAGTQNQIDIATNYGTNLISSKGGSYAPLTTSGNSAKTTGATNANLQARESATLANAIQDKWIKQQLDFQYQSAKEAMEFSAAEAQKNRDFQEMMSNTSYQRAMADMKKAGLNPILAFQQGGASTPSGASAQGIAMSGAGGSAHQAQVFKGNEIEEIFSIVANTAMGAMSLISKLK